MPDITDYFNSRLIQEMNTQADNGVSAGYDSLMQAKKDKINALSSLYERQLKEEAIRARTLVGKMGLEDGTITNSVVDGAAHFVKGAGVVAGQTAALIPNLTAAGTLLSRSDEQVQAYARYKNNKATPEDIKLLNTPTSMVGKYDGQVATGNTPLQSFKNEEIARSAGRDITNFFDVGSIADGTKQDKLNSDIGNGFDQNWEQTKKGFKAALKGDASGVADTVAGTAKLIFNAGEAVVNNPEAAGQYVVENIPQLAIGAVAKIGGTALAVSNIGYAADNFSKGIDAYQKQNNGALPSLEDRQTMAMQAASLAIAEHAGDHLGLDFMKTAKDATGEVVKTGFKKGVVNTLKAGAEGFGSEAATEGYQTYMEGEVTQKPATAKEVFTGGVIGGVAGAGMSAGGRGVAELSGATPEHAANKLAEYKSSEDFLKAAEANDSSSYLDSSKQSYDPAKAVAVHLHNAQRADATLEEKQANLEQAHKIVSDIQDQQDTLKQELARTTPEGIQAEIDSYQSKLASATPEQVASIQKVLPILEEEKASIDPANMDAKAKKSLEETKNLLSSRIAKLDTHITNATEATNAFSNLAQPKVEEVAATVALANSSPDTENAAKAAERVISLAMAHPGSVSTEQITQLINNAGNSLTAPQRKYLQQYTAAQIAENQAKGIAGVHKEVFDGDPAKGQLGIASYREKIGQALLGGNQKLADRSMDLMNKFVSGHQAKAAYLSATLAKAKASKSTIQVLPNTKTGVWEEATQAYSYEDLKKLNGYEIHLNSDSKGLISTINTEADALQKAQAALQSAYDLKFTQSSTVDSNTQATTVAPVVAVATPTTKSTPNQSTKVDSTVTSKEQSTKSPEAPAVKEVAPKNTKGRTAPKDYDNIVGAILRVTGGKGINTNMALDLVGDAAHTTSRVRYAFSSKGTMDIGEVAMRLREEENYDVTDETHLADLLREHEGGNPVLSQERMQVNAARNEEKKHKEYVRDVSQQAKDLGLKGVRGRRTLDMVEADIAKLDAERSTWEAEQENLGKLMEEMDLLVTQANELGVPFSKIEQLMQPTIAANTGSNNGQQSSTRTAEAKSASPKVSQGETKGSTEEQPGNGTTQEGTSSNETNGTSEVKEGKLGVLQKKSEGTVGYKVRNLIADFFTQNAGSDTGTKRPLVAIKDFMSMVAAKAVSIGDFINIKEDTVLTDQQISAWTTFQKKASDWSKVIQSNLFLKENSDYHYNDLMQFLTQNNMVDGKQQLDLEENVKTAISYAAFSWVAENATRSAFNTPEEINIILGRDEDAPVSDYEMSVLGRIGTRQNVVANSLGQRAVAALGLKTNKNAPANLMPQLESVMGMLVAKVLLDQQILTRKTLSEAEMKSMTNNDGTKGESHFLVLTRSPDYKLTTQAEEIYQGNKGSQGFLDKVFSVEPGLKEPSFTPIPFIQKTTRNTNQKVPAKLAKIIAEKNAEANFVRQDMWNLISQLSEPVALAIAGVSSVSENDIQVSKRASIAAKNDGLVREYQRLMDFFGGMKDMSQAMYFEHSVWKQQRVGIATNMINPQTSKIHRFMLFRKAWETKVDMNDTKQMDNFKLRVLEGLGTKTDKQANVNSLVDYSEKVNAPEIQGAVAVLLKTMRGEELTSEDQQALLKGVKKGGEKFHSLDALMALAHEAFAKESKKTEFTVQMMGEVDGVTNGPMLSHLLLGAANTVKELFTTLNRGGFFQVSNKDTQYNVWRGQPGNQDLYETTIRSVLDKVAQLTHSKGMDAVNPSILNAVYAFTGILENKEGGIEKAGRNIIKTPLTAMVFGSSVTSALDSMADKFVESVYDAMEATATNKKDALLHKDLIAHLKMLGVAVDPKADLMEITFDTNVVAALKNAFKNTLGKAVKETMEVKFANFMAKRKQLNKAAQLSFELYNTAYSAIRETYIQELLAKEEANPGSGIAYTTGKDGRKIAIHSLTNQQETELRDRVSSLAPVMHTLMSKDSNDLSAGLTMSKTSRRFSAEDPYKSQVKYGQPFADGTTTTRVNSYERAEAAPGVAMVPMGMHSTDSAISHYAAQGNEVLNIHDAHGSGLGGFSSTATNLNQATWNAMLNYSPANEIYEALARTIQGLNELLQNESTPASVKEEIAKVIASLAAKDKTNASGYVMGQLLDIKNTAYTADQMKLLAMQQMTSVDQYALEGGNYVVTEQDRSDAAKKESELVPSVSKEVLSAVQALEDSLAPVLTTKKAATTKEPAPTTSVWGEIGASTIDSDASLVSLFKAGNLQSVTALIAAIEGKLNPANRLLLKLVQKIINPNLTIQYITATTPEEGVISKEANARGWFSYKGTEEAVYILGAEFKNSGVTPELILHELIHASLARTINKNEGPAKALIAELESLRILAKAFIEKNPTLKKHTAAVGDVHELLSWGMSSQSFQKDVLTQLTFESKTKSNVLVTGMQKFINTLAGLLFKNPNAQINNGLAVLMSNAAGLFAEANNTKVTTDTHSSAMATATNIVNMTTIDIYEAIHEGGISTEFDAHLRGLLDSIITKLHGPFGTFKALIDQNQALTPMEIWLKATAPGGIAPFASAAMSSGFKINKQTAFVMEQIEASVQSALNDNKAEAHDVYTELSKLYLEVRNKLNNEGSDFYTGDWATATQSEKDNAKSLYDFLFKMDDGIGSKTNYLSRFVALGLAHPEVNKVFQMATDKKVKSTQKSFVARLESVFQQVLEFLSNYLVHTKAGQQVDTKLSILMDQLVSIEAKRKVALLPVALTPTEIFEQKTKAMAQTAKDKVAEFGKSQLFQSSKNGFVTLAGNTLSVVAGNRVGEILDAFQVLRDQEFKKGQGILAGIINELRGEHTGNTAFHALNREGTRRQGVRETAISSASRVVLESFANKGADLTEQDKAAITAVFMRADVQSLMDHHSMSDIQTLLSDSAARAKAIQGLENQLNQFPDAKEFYKIQAKGLGYKLATGHTKIPQLLMNVGNIASMWGTNRANKIPAAQVKAAAVLLDQLVTLHAITYSNAVHLNLANTIMTTETARGDQSGVEMVLKMHKALQQQSKERLFSGSNEGLMMKGYIPEIYDPTKEVKLATKKDGELLVAQGYTEGKRVAVDPHDPNKTERFIYTRNGGGLRSWLTGIFSYTGERAKGSRGATNDVKDMADWKSNQDDLQTMYTRKQKEMNRVFKNSSSFNPEEVEETYASPIFNAKGEITDYRYLMNEASKDALLNRDNNFDSVMGAFAGNIYDKQSTKEHNRAAVEALFEQYKSEYSTRSGSYRSVGPNSTDPELRDIYRMLPEDTKQAIKDIWGDKGMMVRADLMDINFGYRKWSLTNAFDRAKEERGIVDAVFVDTMKLIMGEKAAYNIRRGEDIWQELVHETKDILVVKNMSTLLGNIGSNLSLLYWYGVSTKDIAHHHRIALKGAIAYRKDSAALADLEIKLASGRIEGSEAEMRATITRLHDAIEHNPVKDMIDAGLMPTIVEDVAPEDNKYSYKAGLINRMSKHTAKLPSVVVNTAKVFYMAKDTKAYQALSHATQLSDFVARYTLYQHLINKKVDPMDKTKAVQLASDAFINYDLPSHRALQYGNDMGVIWFTKYYLRIQKVIGHLYAENPGRAIALLSMNHYFNGLPLVTDSGVTQRSLHNPFSLGALKYPGTLDELSTVKAGMQLFH